MEPQSEKPVEPRDDLEATLDGTEGPDGASGGSKKLPEAGDGGSGSNSSDDSSSGSSSGSSDSEDDSDSSSGSESEESDEEEEEPEVSRPSKRKTGGSDSSRKKRFRFLDVEADVGSSDEEEEDFIDDEGAKGEAREGARESRELELLRREAEQRRKAGGGNRLQSVIQRLEERAARQPAGEQGEGETGEALVPVGVDDREDFDEGEFAMAAATSAALFPTADDFKLFFVRMAEPGKERDAVIQLSHKAAAEMRDGKECSIRSVFSIDSLRGYIYVEAPNDSVAKNFLMGIRKVQWYNLTVVPQSEMASVFRAAIEDSNEKFRQLQPGEFVRIKRNPIYKGDLAMVVECYDRDVEVALVPRIDWFGSGLTRPVQSMFDERVVEGLGVGEVERLRNPSSGEVRNHYKNEVFNDDGFLIKRFTRQTLLMGDDVAPRIAELRWFKSARQSEKSSPKKDRGEDKAIVPVVAGAHETVVPKSLFTIGEIVRVTSGDMKNLIGKIILIDKSGIISLKPVDESLGLPAIQILARDVQKHFNLSDHVEILQGSSSGDTGIITAINKGVCVVLIDGELRDVQVNANSLRFSEEISKGEVQFGGFSLGQLVQITKPIESTGLVVRISKSGNFAVLGVDGKRYAVTLSDISAAKTSRDATSITRHGDAIRRGSVVKYFDESNQVKTGTVKEIYRTSVFVKENEKVENSGFSVVESKLLEVVASGGHRSHHQPQQAHQPQQQSSGGAGVAYRRPGQSKLEGKRVRIIKGPYKGQLAQVREDHDTRVQVSLEAKFRVVTIPKDCVRLEDEMDEVYSSPAPGSSGNVNQPPMGSLLQPPAGYVAPSSTPYTPAPPHLGR